MGRTSPLAVRIRTDPREVDSAAWHRLRARAPASIAGSRAWVEAAFAHAHSRARPFLVEVRADSELVGLLALAMHESPSPTLRFAGAPHNDLADIVVLPGWEQAAAAAALEVLESAARDGWRVRLEDVDPDGALAAADRVARVMTWEPSDAAPVVNLRGEWRAAASRRRRAQWDRKLRRLSERHDVQVRRLTGAAALRALPAFLRLREARRIATRRPPELPPTPFLVDVMRRLSPAGRCALVELALDGEPVASDVYQVDPPLAMMWVRGLHPSWHAFPCGHLLLRATAEELSGDGFAALDLGRGDEAYKFAFGGDDRVLVEGNLRPSAD